MEKNLAALNTAIDLMKKEHSIITEKAMTANFTHTSEYWLEGARELLKQIECLTTLLTFLKHLE